MVRPDVEVRPLQDGAVLVNLRSGAVFETNRVGAEVWTLVSQGADAADICDTLSRRYSVDRSRLEADVTGLIESMSNAGLIARDE
jgi:hypothetical protein